MTARELYDLAERYRGKRDYAEKIGDYRNADRYDVLARDAEEAADEAAFREARQKRALGLKGATQ